MDFHKNVFVNCPFDEDYRELLRSLLFTIAYLGFRPRIALEATDSGTPRIEKIVHLIQNSQYAVHDLSRMQARGEGELYRLNMPFEFGLDAGCRFFGRGRLRRKRCLVLEEQQYRYRAAFSDLSGFDIAVHGRDPRTLSAEVRNWLCNQGGLQCVVPERAWTDFLQFMSDNYRELRKRGYSDSDIERLPVSESVENMNAWIARNASAH